MINWCLGITFSDEKQHKQVQNTCKFNKMMKLMDKGSVCVGGGSLAQKKHACTHTHAHWCWMVRRGKSV